MALPLARAAGDSREIASSLIMIGFAAMKAGDATRAEAFFLAAQPFAQDLGDRWNEGMITWYLGQTNRLQGNTERAASLYEEAVRIFRETGNALFMTMAMNTQGMLICQQGRYAEAASIHLACLRASLDIGNLREVSVSLEGLAASVSARAPAQAARLLGAADLLRKRIGAPVEYVIDYDQTLATVHACLTEPAFGTAWTEGRAMTLEQAVEYALVELADMHFERNPSIALDLPNEG
jgi:tetratricopeptide (TPR) repeat protein